MSEIRKIPIAKLITDSYKILIDNWNRYLKLLSVPFIILILIGLAIYFIESEKTRNMLAIAYKWLIPVLMIPIVTSWHRLILLGTNNKNARISYNYSSEDWLYFKALIILVIAFLITNFLLGLLLGPIFIALAKVTSEVITIGIYQIILLIIIFLILCRFLLILPAAALGRKMDIAQSSLSMSGNALRITAAYILALLAPQIVLLFTGNPSVLLISGYESGGSLGIVLLVTSIVIMMTFYTLSVGVVSYAYKSLILDKADDPQ